MSTQIAIERRIGYIHTEIFGPVGKAYIKRLIDVLAPRVQKAPGLLLDLTHARLEITAAEYMELISLWFDRTGTDLHTGVVFDAHAHQQASTILATKSLIEGSRLKTFTTVEAARSWLDAGRAAA